MNVNEVIANRGHVINGGSLNDEKNSFIRMMTLINHNRQMILFRLQ